MAETALEGVPQWKRDLIRRRRAGAGAGGTGGAPLTSPPPPQSAARRGHADMLLQAPAVYHLPAHPPHATPLRDEAEELTYGPGIVKKLKSRYLSLTLREAGTRVRPSIHGLRRAASLEHVLDEPAPPPRKYTPRAQDRPARYRQATRAPEQAVKRARSVDALLRCDSRSGTDEPPSPPPTPPALPPASSPSPTFRPKRPSPLLREAERPPPDLVKQTLKIFEGQPGKRTKSPAVTGQVSDKVKNFSDPQAKSKKTSNGRPGSVRPLVPPRGPLLSPDRRTPPNAATQTTPSLLARPPPSPKKVPSLNSPDVHDRSVSPVYVNRHPVILATIDTSPVKNTSEFQFFKDVKHFELKSPEPSPRTSPLKSPDYSLREKLPIERNGVDRKGDGLPHVRTSTPDPEIASPLATTELSIITPSTPYRERHDSGPDRSESDRQTTDESSSEDEAVFEVNGEEPPYAKAGDKPALNSALATQYSFDGHNGVSGDGDASKSYLPSSNPKCPLPVVLNKVKVIDSEIKVPESPVVAVVVTSPPSPHTPTIVDAKIISPVIAKIIPPVAVTPKAEVVTVPSVTKVDAINKAPALHKERLVPILRPVKDLDSSPALVHYNSPSPQQLAKAGAPNSAFANKAPAPQKERVVPILRQPKDVGSGPVLVHHNSQQLTSREIEKNLINTSKSLEQPLQKVTVSMLDSSDRLPKKDDKKVPAPVPIVETKKQVVASGVILLDVKELVVNEVVSGSEVIKESRSVETTVAIVSNGMGPARVGGRKPHWQLHDTSNTMVFNFSNRKEVPDYVENDGIILRSSKRDKPKPSTDVITLSGLGGETCTDGLGNSDNNNGLGEDGAGDDDWTGRPPSPCDVAFENDNVLINGRSNIAAGKTKTKHLKIKFDESLTRTFEYPSEASLGEELLLTSPASAAPAPPIGVGGSLSTYTPSKVSLQADSFQLGVTRTQSQPGGEGARNGNTNGTNKGTNGDAASSLEDSSVEMNSLDNVKPCDEDVSHTWSHETHKGDGDLLF